MHRITTPIVLSALLIGGAVAPAGAASTTPPAGFTFWVPAGGTETPAEVSVLWRRGKRLCQAELNGNFKGRKYGRKYVGRTTNQNGPPLRATLRLRFTDGRRSLQSTMLSGGYSPGTQFLSRVSRAYVRGLPGGAQTLRYLTDRTAVCTV